MDQAFVLTALGFVPLLIARGFLPLFLAALLTRWAHEWAWLSDLAGLELLLQTPDWARSDAAIGVLGLGSILEAIANREPALRESLRLSEAEFKASLAFGVALLLAYTALSVEQRQDIWASPALALGNLAVALFVAYAVWRLSRTRQAIFGALQDADDSDDLQVQRSLAWMEELSVLGGLLLVLVFPALALGVALIALASLTWLKRHIEAREAAHLVPCEACGKEVLTCAPHCPHCDATRSTPKKVGAFGRILNEQARDARLHQLDLVSRRRCSHCGTRLTGRGLNSSCPACERPAFSDQKAFDAYISHAGSHLPLCLVFLALASAVPVLGVLVGVLYFRTSVAGSLRLYSTKMSQFAGRWLGRLGLVLLLLVQSVPLIGIVSLPLLALIETQWFRTQIEQAATKHFSSPA